MRALHRSLPRANVGLLTTVELGGNRPLFQQTHLITVCDGIAEKGGRDRDLAPSSRLIEITHSGVDCNHYDDVNPAASRTPPPSILASTYLECDSCRNVESMSLRT